MPASDPARAALAVLLAGAALPAGATAAELAPLSGCYRSLDPADGRRERVRVAGRGFTPGSRLDVSVDGRRAASVRADAAGALPATPVPAPYLARGERAFLVSVSERGNPLNTAARAARVTALGVRLEPPAARPAQVIRWSGRGFEGRPLYVHYVFAGAERRTLDLGVPGGRCGTFSSQRPQFPFTPRTGRWILQLDHRRRYRPAPGTTFVRLVLVVSRA